MHKQKFAPAMFFFAVFGALMLFFVRINPIVVFDADDWLYASYMRSPVPIWGGWNPTRILPEIFMPFVSNIGAFILYPLTGDYLGALTTAYGVAVSASIVGYLYVVYRFLCCKVTSSKSIALGATALFLLLHFNIFKVGVSNNSYLFFSADATCYFFYTIPTLWIFSMIGLLELHPEWYDFTTNKHLLPKSILLAAAYLLVFSNLYCSYLLALWCGFKILQSIQLPFQLRQMICKNAFPLVVLAAWFVSLVFELNGGRADSLSQVSFREGLLQSIQYFFKTSYGPMFKGVAVGCVVLGVVLMAANRKEDYTKAVAQKAAYMVASAVLSLIFLLLLTGVTIPSYIARADVTLGAFVWALGSIVLLAVYIAEKLPLAKACIPLLLVLQLFSIQVYSFMGSINPVANVHQAQKINEDILQQFEQGIERGDEMLQLHIPALDPSWPLPPAYIGDRMAETLYRHRVIPYKIQVIAVQDAAMNERYGIGRKG